MRRFLPLLLIGPTLGACASNNADYAALLPRAGEAIDPRVAVIRPLNERPASAVLLAQLERLVASARAGDAAFISAFDRARNLSASAGAPQSESWVAAQQSLSQAIEARLPAANALGDVDAISARLLQENGGIAPNDLKAIQDSAAAIVALDQRQAEAVASLRARLGI